MIALSVFLTSVVITSSGPATESYKDQYCTDPRTMKKHAAYSEWADAYSCSRHRCQPGGRNLAIYTVGCKRVEAPESAIECEEVVEDTNIQFPFCCMRLRCLVLVRGEVWTRVLGQPWETLPLAPWSHMYKMKKPPPADERGPKNIGPGLVYEPQDNNESPDKALRSSKKSTSAPDCNEPVPRSAPAPDIVIALATSNDEKEKKNENPRHKRIKNPTNIEEETDREHNVVDFEETSVNEKIIETSDEKLFRNSFGTEKEKQKRTWTDIPQNQWNEHDPSMDLDNAPITEEKNEKPNGLQELVDAIGNRMRDIESVVQKMSEKVHKEGDLDEKRFRADIETSQKQQKFDKYHEKEGFRNPKKVNPNNDLYKRFPAKKRGSKYLHPDVSSDKPIFVEDNNLNGYFSDASNSVRRSNAPKEPSPTYVAPVESNRKSHNLDISEEGEKKRKKHIHKKKRKGKGHKKHHKDEKRKHFNKVTSIELDKNVISLEDSSITTV